MKLFTAGLNLRHLPLIFPRSPYNPATLNYWPLPKKPTLPCLPTYLSLPQPALSSSLFIFSCSPVYFSSSSLTVCSSVKSFPMLLSKVNHFSTGSMMPFIQLCYISPQQLAEYSAYITCSKNTFTCMSLTKTHRDPKLASNKILLLLKSIQIKLLKTWVSYQ